MVFQIFIYTYKTIANEIAESSKMIKEVFYYHTFDIFEKRDLKKKKKVLKKKLKKSSTYQEWRFYAQEYDNLKG